MASALRPLLLASLVGALASAPAAAQIFAALDAKGTTVLSDRRIERSTTVFNVSDAPSYRVTTEAGDPNPVGFENAYSPVTGAVSIPVKRTAFGGIGPPPATAGSRTS